MKKSLLLITDLLFLTRPIVIVPVWAFGAFGAYAAKRDFFITDIAPRQYLLMILYSLSAAAVYVVNQIADREVDMRNGGFPLLVSGNIPIKAAWACAAACALLSTIIPFFMGHITVTVLALIAMLAGCVYSFRPFYLSGRPFFDFLTNAFEAFLAFAAGWHIAGGKLSDPLMYKYALPYFLLMCAGSISSTIPDIPGDRECGKITTAVKFGPTTAHRAALTCLSISIPVSLMISKDYLATACAAIVIPTYIPYLVNPQKSVNSELTYKAGGAITMLAAACVIPMLLPAGAIIYFMTWAYFRKRHNVAYPSLKQAR